MSALVLIANDIVAKSLIDSGIAIAVKDGSQLRIDTPVSAGAPDTVTLPTGHVVSKARPDLGEMMMGYMQRVHEQIELDPRDIGAYAVFQSGLRGDVRNADDWPKMADEFACIVMGRANPYAG